MLHKINTGNFHILYLIEFKTDVTALLISILLQLYIMSVNNFIMLNVIPIFPMQMPKEA